MWREGGKLAALLGARLPANKLPAAGKDPLEREMCIEDLPLTS